MYELSRVRLDVAGGGAQDKLESHPLVSVLAPLPVLVVAEALRNASSLPEGVECGSHQRVQCITIIANENVRKKQHIPIDGINIITGALGVWWYGCVPEIQ